MQRVKALVFDWAGTVVDYGSLAPMGAFVETFAEFGVAVSIDEARGPMGMAKRPHITAIASLPRVSAAWAARHGRPPTEADLDRLYADFVPRNTAVAARYAAVIPGVAEVVAELRREGVRIGSTTGYTREIMAEILPVAAAGGFVPDSLVCTGDTPEGRPSPYMMYKTFLDLAIWPAWDAIKVDDTEVGIAEGRNAGAWTVGVSVSGNAFGLALEDKSARAGRVRASPGRGDRKAFGRRRALRHRQRRGPPAGRARNRRAPSTRRTAVSDQPPSEGDVNLSPARARWRASLSERARTALDEDERFFLRQSLSTPCLLPIERAEGAVLVDVDGRRIYDFHGNSVHQLGHGHPNVVEAIRREMESLPFCPRRYSNPTATALARKLIETSPKGLDKVLFAPSGSAAISMALKLARTATGRHATLSLWDSFHGANLDAIAVGGEALFRRGLGPMAPGAEHLPPLDLVPKFFGGDRPFERFADYIDYALAQGEVSALIAEPMRWTTVEAPPQGFWPSVKDACRRHGALFVFDEIPSGLGRTGTLWASEQFATVPDILVVGKGLGGGIMPLAAILAAGCLDCAPEAAIGHYTHEKSPVAAAAGLATLETIEAEGLVERANVLGRRGLQRLQALAIRFPVIRHVRGLGAYFGVEIGGDDPEGFAERVLYESLARGLSFKIGGGNVVTLCPPLTIPFDEFDEALEMLEAAFSAASPDR
jgi:4-aminobutyrate aminotransferase